MHDSSFWYQYSTVGAREETRGGGGGGRGTAPLGPLSDPPMTVYIMLSVIATHFDENYMSGTILPFDAVFMGTQPDLCNIK